MKFTPKYTVSYHGAFHPAGKPFDIAADDVEEMRNHGTVETMGKPDVPPTPPAGSSNEPPASDPDEPVQSTDKKSRKPEKTE